jgi:collagen type III alpha
VCNPYRRFWFSEGFLTRVASEIRYKPSSGNLLLEFDPPSLRNTSSSASPDTAQIGVGEEAERACSRFNFYGANLGCDSRSALQDCEYTFSGYRYNYTKQSESLAMSRRVWVPPCPRMANCTLTTIQIDGFDDLSSILITLKVDGHDQSWWADDLKLGWTDNSCDATICRDMVPAMKAKRGVTNASRKEIWHWTPGGLQRLAIPAKKV